MQFTDLGKKNYRDSWALQQHLQNEVIAAKQNKTPLNYVLLVEHPPVYTLGRNGNEANLLVAQQLLQNVEVIRVDRGGDITFHGYGQLVAYPIIDLEHFKLGLKDYVHHLEQVVINTIAHYGIQGERIKGSTGVWIDKGTLHERKICAIGVKCSHYVTMHGLALNVNTNLSYFNYINPCGFVNKGVTSIEKETEQPITLNDVKPIFIEEFKAIFGTLPYYE